MQALSTVEVQRGKNVTASPSVSILVPSYNTSHFIAESLDSVLAQTYKNYECIVVNDGSPDTDELERVLVPYRDHIVYAKQENRGLSGARNTALRLARGPLIALLDSDDLFEPSYLEVQVAFMERDPTIDVLYPNAVLFGNPAYDGREFMDLCPSEGEVTFESVVTRRCHVIATVIARRESLMRVGMFDEELGRGIPEDFDMWLRILHAGGRIAYHRRVLVRYRRHADSITANDSSVLKCALRALNKVSQTMTLTKDERMTVEREITLLAALLCYSEGREAFLKSDVRTASLKLKEANGQLKSNRLRLALLLLRFSPKALLGLYSLKQRALAVRRQLQRSTEF